MAIRTGAPSDLVVVDIDPRHGGIDSLRALIARHGALPAGLRCRTGSGGWHLYFAHPGGTVRNSAGRLGPGLDVRGDGGYVVAPPSLHPSGTRYTFRDAETPVPALPAWLERLVRPEPPPPRENEPIRLSDAVDAWARAAVLDEARRVRTAPEGTRNATLNRAAFNLGQIVGAGVVDDELVRDVLADSALAAGLARREIDATIRSGLTAGAGHPRGPRSSRTPSAEPPLPS